MKRSLINQIKKAQNGDEHEMNELISNNIGLVWNIVKRFKGRGYEIEDLYQIGIIGLIKCIKNFDMNYEVELSTYAVPYILGEIKRFIRDDGIIKVSRHIKELSMKISYVQKEYRDKTGKEIGIEEIANILDVSIEEVNTALESLKPVESYQKEVYDSGDSRILLIDTISNDENQEEVVIDKILLSNVINSLSSREKQIILLRYYRGKTQTEVANLIGITQVQVSRIERKILDSMKLQLIG